MNPSGLKHDEVFVRHVKAPNYLIAWASSSCQPALHLSTSDGSFLKTQTQVAHVPLHLLPLPSDRCLSIVAIWWAHPVRPSGAAFCLMPHSNYLLCISHPKTYWNKRRPTRMACPSSTMSGIPANDMEARGLLKPSFGIYSVTFVAFYHSTQSQDSRVDRLCFSLESESVICSVVSNSFATPCSGACQVPLSMEFSRQKILEWVAIPFSKVSSLTQGSNLGLLHCRQILYHLSHQVAKNWEGSFPTLPERAVLSPLLNPVPWFLYLHLFLAV